MGIGLTLVILLEVIVFTVLGFALWRCLGGKTVSERRDANRRAMRPERIVADFYGERG